MDISRMLVQYLDTGVDGHEIRQLCRAAIAQRIREIKLAAAQAVVQAKSCDLTDNPEGSNAALYLARSLQREYHEFYAQWLGLEGPVAVGSAEGAERPGKDEGPPGGAAEEEEP